MVIHFLHHIYWALTPREPIWWTALSEPASTHPQRVHESTNRKTAITVSGCANGSNEGISAGNGKSCRFNSFSPARGTVSASRERTNISPNRGGQNPSKHQTVARRSVSENSTAKGRGRASVFENGERIEDSGKHFQINVIRCLRYLALWSWKRRVCSIYHAPF